MKTAQEMFKHTFGDVPIKDSDEEFLNDFLLIEETLDKDEEVFVTFIGIHNFTSLLKNDGVFVYAITNKRIILAQDTEEEKKIHTIDAASVDNITVDKKWLEPPVITIDTAAEKIRICSMDGDNQSLGEKIQNHLTQIKENRQIKPFSTGSAN